MNLFHNKIFIKTVLLICLLLKPALSSQQEYLDADKWSAKLSLEVNKHFKNEYEDDKNIFKHKKNINIIHREIDKKKYTVNRKRHGLAHGVKQGFLAVDIVKALQSSYKKSTSYFNIKRGNDLMKWVNTKLKQDPFFIQKVELVSVFQRTGRESEASSTDYPELYKKYKQADASNFAKFAKQYVGYNNLFKNNSELKIYIKALKGGSFNDESNKDLFYLQRLCGAAHMFDLRRVPTFDKDEIYRELSGILFNSLKITPKETNFIDKLWSRAGEYNEATGDRDLVTKRGRFRDRFFILSNDPKQLSEVLHTARKNSKIIL